MADTEAIRGLLQDGDKVIIPYVNPATKTNEGIVKVDDALSSTSENPVQNKVINTALGGKQATLVSGTNIKTVNNTSILGNGNIAVQPVINDLSDIRSNATAGAGAASTISGYGDIVTHDADEFMSSSTVIGNAEIEIQKNGTKVDSFTANQSGNKKTINITVPTTASDVSALPSSTKYGSTIDVTLSTTDYKQTIVLKDQDGNTLSSKVVDFPVESMVVSGTFDSTNKKIVLTLQNGNTTDIPVGDLISGLQTEITSTNKLDADFIEDTLTTKKLVTTAEKNTWNGKQDAISDLSTIRSNAQAGKNASDTISGYGDIVTHDASEFLTEHQDLSGYQTKITSSNKLSADLLSEGTTNKLVSASEKSTWNGKQNALVSGTNIKTVNNTSLLGSGNVAVQPTLVSGTNIKTINGNSLLGSGNITIEAGSDIDVDTALSTTSENPVQNKVITTEINKKLENTATGAGALTIEGTASSNSAAINIGNSSEATANNSTALGYRAQATANFATAIGRTSKASGVCGIQIGYGTNSTDNTLSIGFYNNSSTHYNWQLLDGTTGLIPTARIDTDTTATSGSAKPITSGAVYTILGDIETLINAL